MQRSSSVMLMLAGLLLVSPSYETEVDAGVLLTGTILVTDPLRDAVFQVDPVSGDRTILSSSSVGAGPLFGATNPIFGGGPAGIGVNSAGDVFVVNTGSGAHAIYGIDAMTGDRHVVSGSAVGSGFQFSSPGSLVVGPDGMLYVTDVSRHGVFRVDPATGNRTLISGGDLITGVVGTGAELFPSGIAFEAAGTIVVTDPVFNSVVRIDPSTGNRTVVSSSSVGGGSNLADPTGITVGSTGDIFISDTAFNTIRRIDPTTGDRTTIADFFNGSGASFFRVGSGILSDPNGDILFSETFFDSLFRIDAVTLNRTVLSGDSFGPSVGSGTGFGVPGALAIVPVIETVPEPSSLALLGMGALGFIGYGWRRKRKRSV